MIEVLGADAIVADLTTAPGRVSRAAKRAIDRGMTAGRALMASLIAKDVGHKVGDVREALTYRLRVLDGERTIDAVLASKLSRIRLIKFGAKGPTPSRGQGTGVTYRLGAKGRNRLPHAFITAVRAGDGSTEGVFMRKGKSRLPIRQLYGPSLGHVFARFRPQGLARAREQFEKTLNHELARELAAQSSVTVTEAGGE